MSTDSTPTIVLVHGAWADGTGFDGKLRALRAQGLRAVAPANPLRSLTGDAAYRRRPGRRAEARSRPRRGSTRSPPRTPRWSPGPTPRRR